MKTENRMVFAIIWKDASNVFIFASTNIDQVVLWAVGALDYEQSFFFLRLSHARG